MLAYNSLIIKRLVMHRILPKNPTRDHVEAQFSDHLVCLNDGIQSLIQDRLVDSCGRQGKAFNLSMASKKVNKFRTAVSKLQETGVQAVYREREKLVRNYENLLNELHTYENNFGFLNATSKSGSSLLTELSKKMDKLKAEIEVAKEKIRHIDENIQQDDEKAE